MSGWLGTLAGNVESLLDKVDQVAGQALLKDEDSEADLSRRGLYYLPESEWDVPPPQKVLGSGAVSGSSLSDVSGGVSVSSLSGVSGGVSVSSLSGVSGGVSGVSGGVSGSSLSTSKSDAVWTGSQSSQRTSSSSVMEVSSPTLKHKMAAVKDPDHELFEFLNSPESVVDRVGSVVDGNMVDGSVLLLRDMSRPASNLSTVSSHGRRSPEGGHEVTPIANVAPVWTEVTSLETLRQRLVTSQDELSQCRRQLETQRRQLSQSEQTSSELKRRDADTRELLAAKDAQIGVLRTRLDEADQELQRRNKQLTQLNSNQDRILAEQTTSSGTQRQTLESLQEKLKDTETELNREREEFHRANDELTRHCSRLEADKQSLMLEISTLQKGLNRERARCSELSSQLKVARTQSESAKQELADYKDKASRILQSKEKLIVSLKDGGSVASKGSGAELAVLVSELESSRQERDVVREQQQTTQLALDSLRAEMSELESQLQHESESNREQLCSLEEQVRIERRRREDAEFDLNKQKQELRTMHDELVKQKNGFLSRLQSRDDEIGRLRSQLVAKSMNVSNQEELESRLRTLTESLIQKQTTLESMNTEKNSLQLQLERMERHCREAETSALRAASTNVNISTDDNDEVRQRLPGFMSQSPLDGNVTRRVKMAAGVIDRLGIHLGVFLRRYPVARVMMILYMGLLHLWVMLVMLTYQPETHLTGFLPQQQQQQQQQHAALPLPPP